MAFLYQFIDANLQAQLHAHKFRVPENESTLKEMQWTSLNPGVFANATPEAFSNNSKWV